MSNVNNSILFDQTKIKEVLPHRDPFLFLDSIIEIKNEKRIVAQRTFTVNEYFFKGHFPNEPVVPGVVQLEAMAQAASFLALFSFTELKGKRPAFAGIDAVKFRAPIYPEDMLVFAVETIKNRRGFMVFNGTAHKEDKLVASAVIKATMV